MGTTFRFLAGGGDAREGVFGDGRTSALRGPPARGRSHVRSRPRVRHLPQDRLQDPQSLQGVWARSPVRPLQTAVRYANQLPLQIESLIIRAKKERSHWGARKIRELLVKRL